MIVRIAARIPVLGQDWLGDLYESPIGGLSPQPGRTAGGTEPMKFTLRAAHISRNWHGIHRTPVTIKAQSGEKFQ